METEYDSTLTSITPCLFMLPWIGEKYRSTGILFIGESDYYDGAQFDNNWKREWILKERIQSTGKGSKLLNNIDRTFLDHLNFENQSNLWNSIAYTNLVQRPMNWMENKNDKPNYDDFFAGWKTTLQAVFILKPKFIIKWGFSGDGVLRDNICNEKYVDWKCENINDNNRFLLLKHTSNYEVKILFIRHPSMYYSWSTWKEYIHTNLPELKSCFDPKKD